MGAYRKNQEKAYEADFENWGGGSDSEVDLEGISEDTTRWKVIVQDRWIWKAVVKEVIGPLSLWDQIERGELHK